MKRRFQIFVVWAIVIATFGVGTLPALASYDVYNQDVTAYTAPSGALTASELVPQVGYVAVHKYNGQPIVPFGTVLITSGSIELPSGVLRNVFQVQDLGDLDWRLSSYWIDVYFGLSTTANKDKARTFGLQKRDITFLI